MLYPPVCACFYLHTHWDIIRSNGTATQQQTLPELHVLKQAPLVNASIQQQHTLIQLHVLRAQSKMFRSKRKDSAIRSLVAETLVLAKTHGYVEKIEQELEEELQKENTQPSNRILDKWRRNGETLLKNKYTVLTVALFCVTECALILGELILDLHKVKVVLETQEADARMFVDRLHKLYPELVYPDDPIVDIYDGILRSKIIWNDIHNSSAWLQENARSHTRHRRSRHGQIRHRRSGYSQKTLIVVASEDGQARASDNETHSRGRGGHQRHGLAHPHSLEEKIAHAFHIASISILSVLVFETILKALCAGEAFFQRKLETFDLCVVIISFVVDLVCMQIMPRYQIQDFVFILAFLLPWRVIRVVNSLVVAVQDHEHFRLKLIYGRKKKILHSLRESELKLQLFRAQCNALKRLCFNEGIDESKIDQILMVEECVVNKAAKSKCKIKIDNSSVILLNDKSDFPRLSSPRPSLLNLMDKTERRKSMQQPIVQVNERDLFLNTKDASKRGILKSRARSNSESGRGTLSSPEDGGRQNSFGDSAGYSGLSTPIIINRKSSLNSPMMVNHIRNILNSLEDKVNQMNGGCNRSGGGRGSIDTDSIPEDGEIESVGQVQGRRVDSIEEQVEGVLDCDPCAVSFVSKRRASLQPQKCVDEDDANDDSLLGDRILTMPTGYIISAAGSKQAGGALSSDDNVNCVTDFKSFSAIVQCHQFIPTTIQIDPPSIHSNYSLSSSDSSGSSNLISINYPEQRGFTVRQTSPTTDTEHKYSNPVTMHSCSRVCQDLNSPPTITKTIKTDSCDSLANITGQKSSDRTPSLALANFKPKTLRTPSDVENENNLTFSESTDMSDSQINELSTRNTSIDDCEDNFDHTDNGVPLPDQHDANIEWKNYDPHLIQRTVNVTHQIENTRLAAASETSTDATEDSCNSSLYSVNEKAYPVHGSSVDPPECDNKCGPVTYLLT